MYLCVYLGRKFTVKSSLGGLLRCPSLAMFPHLADREAPMWVFPRALHAPLVPCSGELLSVAYWSEGFTHLETALRQGPLDGFVIDLLIIWGHSGKIKRACQERYISHNQSASLLLLPFSFTQTDSSKDICKASIQRSWLQNQALFYKEKNTKVSC